MNKRIALAVLLILILSGCLPPVPPPLPSTVPAAILPTHAADEPDTAPAQPGFPGWLVDANPGQVLITNTCPSEQRCTLSLVDATSGTRYDLPVAGPGLYFWLPGGEGLGLVTNDRQFTRFDFASGEKIQTMLEPAVLDFFPDALPARWLRPAYLAGDPAAGRWWLLPEDRGLSFDQAYLIQQDFSQAGNPLLIEDLRAGERFLLSGSEDGWYNVEAAWSPVRNLLAVLQAPTTGELSGNEEALYPVSRLMIFDVELQQILGIYPGNFARLAWSPDGRSLLFQVRDWDGESYLPEPCLIDPLEGSSLCLNAIFAAAPQSRTGYFQWLPDGSGIVYLQYAPSGDSNQLCQYAFQSDTVTCTSAGPSWLTGRKITAYQIAPDGQGVFFTHDTPTAAADAPEQPLSAWMRLDGSRSIELWSAADYQAAGWNPAAQGPLWNPAPRLHVFSDRVVPQTGTDAQPTPALPCERDTAQIVLSSASATVSVGDPVQISVELVNEGCVALGQPKYTLAILHTENRNILEPREPAPVIHYLAVQPGSTDPITFTLKASSPGKAILRAMASYEVHLSYPGPAYWSMASSKELIIQVAD